MNMTFLAQTKLCIQKPLQKIFGSVLVCFMTFGLSSGASAESQVQKNAEKTANSNLEKKVVNNAEKLPVKEGNKTQTADKKLSPDSQANIYNAPISQPLESNNNAEQEQALTLQEVDRLTQAEIQKAMGEMRKKLNVRIDAWGKKLTRKDFQRVKGKVQLKQAKKVEVCQIFQHVIDETYQLVQVNKQRLTEEDQKIVTNRSDFIKLLGLKDNIVRTEMGFDCRIQ